MFAVVQYGLGGDPRLRGLSGRGRRPRSLQVDGEVVSWDHMRIMHHPRRLAGLPEGITKVPGPMTKPTPPAMTALSSMTRAMKRAINSAYAEGVTIVAAAGNSAWEGNPANYPAAYERVIAVGATNQ